MKLFQTPRVSKDTSLGRTAFALDVGSGQIRADYEVSAEGQTFDAFEIATRAVVAWDAFLAAYGALEAESVSPAIELNQRTSSS